MQALLKLQRTPCVIHFHTLSKLIGALTIYVSHECQHSDTTSSLAGIDAALSTFSEDSGWTPLHSICPGTGVTLWCGATSICSQTQQLAAERAASTLHPLMMTSHAMVRI